MNAKQIVAAVSVVVLIVMLGYPALSSGTVSVTAHSTGIEKADHIYITVNSILAHVKGQSDSNGWKVISNQSQTIDLVSLASSTNHLTTGSLPVADYDSVRLEISNVTWVFNKTTTILPPNSPNLDATLDFTITAGRQVTVLLILSGQQQGIETSRFFAAQVNATATEAS